MFYANTNEKWETVLRRTCHYDVFIQNVRLRKGVRKKNIIVF